MNANIRVTENMSYLCVKFHGNTYVYGVHEKGTAYLLVPHAGSDGNGNLHLNNYGIFVIKPSVSLRGTVASKRGTHHSKSTRLLNLMLNDSCKQNHDTACN
jgi:hypothetical protein